MKNIINKKPINLYWSPNFISEADSDWTFMYEKPKTLFSELKKEQVDTSNAFSFFSCPPVSSKFKKILVFKNGISCSYNYDTRNNNLNIETTSKNFINARYERDAAVKFGPTILLSMSNILFADEPLLMSVTPPMFHKPKYTKYGAMFPGEFDIGQWFRSINFEIQMWEDHGELILEQGEPIFYTEFKTDRPILLHRFEMNKKLTEYAKSNVEYFKLFGIKKPMYERYNRFRTVGYREKILTEIKKNLVEEEPYKF